MKKITAILALLLFQNSYALELTGINGVEILAINGKEVSSGFFSKQENQVNAGDTQVVVRYASQFNNEELIQSRPAIFTLNLTEDTKISTPKMSNQKQIERQIKSGLTWLIISDNNQYEVKDSDILKGKGFMPYSDIEKLIVEYNQQQNITLQTAAVATTATVAVTNKSTVQANSEATLQLLYQQSSKQQKKAFRIWLLDQDMK